MATNNTNNNDHDRGQKSSMEISREEVSQGEAATEVDARSERRLSPVDDLKARLSMWGESRNYQAYGDDDEEEGSEYELLLDPSLPDHQSSLKEFDQESARSFDDEAALKRSSEGSDGGEEDSPYPEVRAAVHNYDQDLPCNTIRAWTIGLTLVVVGASMNTLFSLRSPSISLGTLVAQVISWPMGHGWAMVMPTKKFRTFGISWSLNPGPFNVKEHSVIVVMAGVSFSVAYATDIILAQLVFYNQDFGTVFQLLLTISTQSLGYGIAGVMRRYLGKHYCNSCPPSLPFRACSLLFAFFVLTTLPSLSVPSGYDLAGNPRFCNPPQCHV